MCGIQKILKRTENEYKNKLTTNLIMQEESNPRAFWATLDRLKDMASPKPRTEETIPAKEWLNHLKKLGNCCTNFRLRE